MLLNRSRSLTARLARTAAAALPLLAAAAPAPVPALADEQAAGGIEARLAEIADRLDRLARIAEQELLLRRMDIAERRLAPVATRAREIENTRSEIVARSESMRNQFARLSNDASLSSEERDELWRERERLEAQTKAELEMLDAQRREIEPELSILRGRLERLERLLERGDDAD